MASKTEVLVYADWEGFEHPTLVGTLRSATVRQKEHFEFTYADDWLLSGHALKLDPALALFSGPQHGESGRNFRIFLDSCPDRWGRTLIKRREAIIARRESRRPSVLYEIDYLLGVHDLHRSGALRFKRELDGNFLDDHDRFAAPPLSSLAELERAARMLEEDTGADSEHLQWLNTLLAPGSSLGGARPKACLFDDDRHPWIAKFPSIQDDHDVGAWEYVAYRLALKAGLEMSESHVKKLGGPHHIFVTKRFDRKPKSRVHFTSAMTQLGYYDGDEGASYLELAQFLTEQGSYAREDLAQLWRRIVFSVAISNTDDHLRNHGFVFRDGGWRLSPAFDINPVTPADGLRLNITDSDNSLDFGLALEVIDFFRLGPSRAAKIMDEVLAAVADWRSVAASARIGKSEQDRMASAFRV